jgi:hypothetical protein
MPRYARDSAIKTEVARFKGHHYSAEREGDELVIHSHHDDHGMPAAMDRAHEPEVIRSLGDLNRAWASRKHAHQRRA